MDRTLISTHEPKPSEPICPPVVYVRETVRWEYKQIVRDLEKESPPDEAELNALGAEGWEMSGVVQKPPLAYFHFKRLKDK